MDFKDLKLESSYDKNDPGVNVLNDFYIPVLGESVQYDRIGSYFRSSVFIANAKGIAAFIANGGLIRLIGDVTLLEDDIEAIKRGEDGSINDEQIAEYFKNGISKIKEKIYQDRFEFLSYLIASNKLQIRIAVVEDSNEHSKVGIFKDINENIITFLGSINESLTGWGPQGNVLEIFCSWNDTDRVDRHVETFDRMWNNQGQITKVYNFPKAVKEDLIKSISFDLKDENATKKYLRKKIEEERKPKIPRNGIKKPHFPISYEKRTYQTNAVDNWQKANFRGFFEMATGTGKTITSLRAACRLIDNKDNLFTLILVPSTSLVNQWENDCKLFLFQRVVKVFGDNKSWYNDFLSLITSYNLGNIKFPIAISTYASFKSTKFQLALNQLPDDTLLICDEAHHLGANETKKFIPEKINFRLGLSATPHRHFDDSGTQDLLKYFNTLEEPTYKLDIRDAQDMDALCEYNLYIHEISLDEEEYESYLDITKQIARRVAINNGDMNSGDKTLENLLIKRKKIINHAKQKFNKVYEIIQQIISEKGILNYTLVYCPEGLDEYQESTMKEYGKMLGLDMNLTIRYFVGDTPSKERKEVLESFANGETQAILAMKCLDEGIDVKRTENAILVASSTNPRQYIQRRGRILRTHPDKLIASIHDLFVLPPFDLIHDDDNDETKNRINSINKSLIKQELLRLDEFASSSLNYVENKVLIRKYLDEYEIESP